MNFLDLKDFNSLVNPFGNLSVGKWNLSRGIYTSKTTKKEVVFFYEEASGETASQRTAVDQISDSGGRRLAVYEYPYQDGQKIEDMGRRGETFTFNIKFFGDNHQAKFKEFLEVVLYTRGAGTLIHPVRGAMIVRFSEYEFIHRYDEWNSITIRATFIEDTEVIEAQQQADQVSSDSLLRSALQTLNTAYSFISAKLFSVGALLLLPQAVQDAFKARLDSITGQVSRLLGQLAATFSEDAKLQQLASQASQLEGGLPALSSGITESAKLPPVFQIGFDPQTQAFMEDQLETFTQTHQITTQQAVFEVNQIRQGIRAAIMEINQQYGNDGYDLVMQYRELAISLQRSVETSISTSASQVKLFILQRTMSLRQVAQANGLSPDRQNDIESLNPYLSSVNFIPAGSQLLVPAV